MRGKYGRLVLIGIVLIGAGVIGNAVLYAFGVSPFNTEKIYKSQSVTADGISRIAVGTDDGDVRVVIGGGDAITATVEGVFEGMRKEEVRLDVRERGGELLIEASREAERRLISVNPGEYELLVEVPDKLFEHVEVVAVAADISVEHVRAKQFMLRAVHGEIETVGLSGSITARTDTGDIELGVRAIEGVIVAETTVGDIELATAEAPERLSLELHTVIGEEKVDLPGTAIVAGGPDVPSVRLSAEAGDLEVAVDR